MIRHIVMFKLKEFQTPAEKQAKMQEIKDKLEALINKERGKEAPPRHRRQKIKNRIGRDYECPIHRIHATCGTRPCISCC